LGIGKQGVDGSDALAETGGRAQLPKMYPQLGTIDSSVVRGYLRHCGGRTEYIEHFFPSRKGHSKAN
jgi:hypothetical protein